MNKFLTNLKNKVLTLSSISYIPNLGTATTGGFEGDSMGDTLLQNNYQNSLYISRAIEIIQDVVSGIDIDLFQIINSKGEYKPVEVSPILDLIYKPNPLQTKSEFWRVLIINYKLSGEAFIRIIREENKTEPKAWLNLSPRDVQVELLPTGEIKYILTKADGTQENLTSEQVIHIKNPNPNSQLRGFGILTPLITRIDAEIKATEYQANLFGKNGNPDGVLVVKGQNTPEGLSKIKQAFYNSFRGSNEQNRVAVVGGDANYTPLQTGNNTLDFIASKNNVRDEIFMALGVPKSLITSDDVNRANADAGLQQFMQFTIAPMFKMILEVINERFVIPNYGEEYFLDTEKLVTEDKEQLLKEAQIGVNKWLTVNEVRERYGYEPLEGGDTLNTANQAQDPSLPILANAFKIRQNLYKKLLYTEKFQAYRSKQAYKKATSSPEFKLKFSKAVDSVRTRGENLISRKSKELLKEQKGRILAKLEEVGDNLTTANDIFDHSKEKLETYKTILPLYTTISVAAGNVALTPLKMITGKANNFVMNSVLYKKLEKRADLFSEGITDTTYQKLSTLVADKMSEGVPAIKAGILELFSNMSSSRAESIARTESGYMTSLGSEMAYQESEVVEGKEWLTTGDDRVREEHVQVDGEIVGKFESFSNGEHFPAEHSINCRCALAPVVLL